MKNILVLGGTGAIGRALIDLISSNPDISCVVTSRRKQCRNGRVIYVQGNAHNKEFLTSLLEKKWNAIVDFMSYTTEELKDRIELMLSATEQYIFLSSSRVYAGTDSLLTEDSPRLLDVTNDKEYLKTDEYALAKAREENIIRSFGKRNYTIVRPYITFSETRFQLGVMEKENWIYRALHGRTIVFSKDIAQKVTTLSYGADVAKGIYYIICNEKTYGKTFHITTTENHTWDDILKMYLKAIQELTGKKPNVAYTDKWESWQGGFEYQVKYDRLFNRRFDNSAILRVASNMEFNGLYNSIKSAMSEMVKHPSFGVVDYAKEAAKDRYTGEWTKLSEIPGFRSKVKYILIRLGIIRYK